MSNFFCQVNTKVYDEITKNINEHVVHFNSVDKQYELVKHGVKGNFILQNMECIVIMLDIVGYSSWCINKSSNMIISLLNTVFDKINDINTLFPFIFNLETVGDSWVGICLDVNKVDDVIKMCNIINASINELKVSTDWDNLSFRIGVHKDEATLYINTNSIIPRIQVIGNVMNIAQRLESTCDANTVHITSIIVESLSKDFKNAVVIKPHIIDLKGYGVTNTFTIHYTLP